MAGAGGKDTLQWLRRQGLMVVLSPDAGHFILTGLNALDKATRNAVTQQAREQRDGILLALRNEAAQDARLENNPPELWPLVCHYTSVSSIGHVLAAHRIELERVGTDFRIKNHSTVPSCTLPKLFFFFRHNGDLIKRWLRG